MIAIRFKYIGNTAGGDRRRCTNSGFRQRENIWEICQKVFNVLTNKVQLIGIRIRGSNRGTRQNFIL